MFFIEILSSQEKHRNVPMFSLPIIYGKSLFPKHFHACDKGGKQVPGINPSLTNTLINYRIIAELYLRYCEARSDARQGSEGCYPGDKEFFH